MTGRLWGPSIPHPPPSTGLGSREAFQTHPQSPELQAPEPFCGQGRGLRSAGFLSAGEVWAVRGGRMLQAGGASGAPLPEALLLSPVTLLLRALSSVAYNQVLSYRSCDRWGLTERLLVLFWSYPAVTEMLR